MPRDNENRKEVTELPSALVNDNHSTISATEDGSIYTFAKDTVINPGVLFAAGQFFLFSSTTATLPFLGSATESIAMPLAAVNLGASFALSAYANRDKLTEPIKNAFRKVKDVVKTTVDTPAFNKSATFISEHTPDFIKNNIPKLDPDNPSTALKVNGASISALMAPLMLASGDLPRAGFAFFIGLSNMLKPLELEHKGVHAEGYFKDGEILSATTKKKLMTGEMMRGPGMVSLALAASSAAMLTVAGLGEAVALTALFAPEKAIDAFSDKVHSVASKFNILNEKPKRDAIINSGFVLSSSLSAAIAFSSGAVGAGFGALGITSGNVRLTQLSQAKKAPPKIIEPV